MSASYQVEGTFTPDRLVADGEDLRARKATIASGAGVLKRGTVIGALTSGGKYITSLSAANDGSQVPDAILAEDVDATSADVDAIIYIEGTFNQGALTLGTGHTLGSIDAPLRLRGIFTVKSILA